MAQKPGRMLNMPTMTSGTRKRRKRKPLTAEQYGTVRERMILPGFRFSSFSLANRLSPTEVKAAVDSEHYEGYLQNR